MSTASSSAQPSARNPSALHERLALVIFRPTSLPSAMKEECETLRRVLNRPDDDVRQPRSWPSCRVAEDPAQFTGAHGLLLIIDEPTLAELENTESALCMALKSNLGTVVVVPICNPDQDECFEHRLRSALRIVVRLSPEFTRPQRPEGHSSQPPIPPDTGRYPELRAGADLLWHHTNQYAGAQVIRLHDLGHKDLNPDFLALWTQLTQRQFEIIPIVGAGISKGCVINQQPGFTWKELLIELNNNSSRDAAELIAAGKYLKAAEEIWKRLGGAIRLSQFQKLFPEHNLHRSVELRHATESIVRLAQQGTSRLIVTLNYDHVLEAACKRFGWTPKPYGHPSQQALIQSLLAQPSNHINIVHIHGDVNYDIKYMVFTESQYQEQFGIGAAEFDTNSTHIDKIELGKPLPQNLFSLSAQKNAILLFLGCSLENDHVLATLCKTRRHPALVDHPRPIALLPTPSCDGVGQLECLEARRRTLSDLDCNVIFYPANKHGIVDLFLHELHQARTTLPIAF